MQKDDWFPLNNSRSPFCVISRMMWLLKLQFDQNPIIINHKLNDDLRATSFLKGHKSDTRDTCSITCFLYSFIIQLPIKELIQ
jgi:hypothetical protein